MDTFIPFIISGRTTDDMFTWNIHLENEATKKTQWIPFSIEEYSCQDWMHIYLKGSVILWLLLIMSLALNLKDMDASSSQMFKMTQK